MHYWLGEITCILPINLAASLLEKEKDEGEMNGTETHDVIGSSTTRVLADGTYATESALTESKAAAKLEAVKGASKPPLRCIPNTFVSNGSFDP